MLSTRRTIATLILGTFLVAACGAGGATSNPQGPTAGPSTAGPTVAAPTLAPTATPLPTTDGQGAEHFIGTFTSMPSLTTTPTETTVGEVTRYRGGVAAWAITSNDRRMAGEVAWRFSVDGYGTIGPQWGPFTIDNGSGSWSGTCTAGAWQSSDRLVAGCWLTGGGAYKGLSAYLHFSRVSAAPAVVEGVIFPGAVPKF